MRTILHSHSILSVLQTDPCKELEYLECIQNKSFIGHVINTSKVATPGLQMCQNECFEEDQCVSYNLGPVEGGIRTCELNDADHLTFPSLLFPKNGTEYCPIQVKIN